MRIVVQTLMFDNSFIQMDIVHNTISVLAFFKFCCLFTGLCLASQDALEVMRVTYWLSHLLSISIDFTDVILVSDDTYRRPYWCDPDDPDDPDEVI